MIRSLKKLKTSVCDSNEKDKVFNKSDFREVTIDVSHKQIRAPLGKIVGTAISLMNPYLVVRSSVCEITQNNCNDAGKPRDGSLMDLRMGPIDSMYECLTCEGTVAECKGHPGHINLALPVYHVSFLKPITQCLQSVCHGCSSLLLTADNPRMKKIMAIKNGAKRLTELAKICENITTCPVCKIEQRLYIRQKMNIYCYLRKAKAPSTTKGKKRGIPSVMSMQQVPENQKIQDDDLDEIMSIDESDVQDFSNMGLVPDQESESDNEDVVLSDSSSSEVDETEPSESEMDTEKEDIKSDTEQEQDQENTNYLGFSDSSGSELDSADDEDIGLGKGGDGDDGWDQDADQHEVNSEADVDDEDLDEDDDMNDSLDEDDGERKKRGKPKNDIIINEEDENFDVKYMGASAQIMSASLISKKERKGCGISVPFLADDALKILEKIDPKDYAKLNFTDGLTKPSYMILTVLPIPPPKTRVVMGVNQMGKARIEQDAGRHLKNLVSTNKLLKSKWELYTQASYGLISKKPDEIKKIRASVKQIYDKLIRAVALHIDKDASAISSTNVHGKVNIPSWLKRFHGKTGRIRGTLNAKRMNFCGRGVITPGLNQDVDEFGVPEMVSMSNCVTETVTKWNIADLQASVNRGPNEIRGANSIILPSGEMIDLKFARNLRLRLRVGYKVRRHIRDGDWILYGRQPTLSKMSLKGAKVKVIKGNAFRINLCDSPSFNADCDGDEMGVYFPQTIEAMAEIEEFMRCHSMAINSKDSAAIGGVQDTLLAGTLSSSRNIVHSREEMMDLMTQRKYDLSGGWELPPPAIMVRNTETGQWQEYWSGKQVTTFLSPTEHCISEKRKEISTWVPSLNHSPGINDKTPWPEIRNFVLADSTVVVQRGRLLLGKITKDHIGCSRGGFIQSIFHDFGPEIVRKYVSDLQRVFCYWISQHGFGLGPSDIITNDKTHADISKIKYKLRNHLALDFRHKSGTVLDAYVQEAMNHARNSTGSLACKPQIGFNNRMTIIIASKAKASELNIAQSSAMVGQVKVSGKRPGRVMNGYRCSSHFAADTCDPVDQGAVFDAFSEGLSMIGYGRHAVGAREGLVDTATKTASVGYMMHRFMRVSEDLMNEQDGTVRDPNSGIVSVRYGGDGFDCFMLETQTYPVLNSSLKDIQDQFGEDEAKDIWQDVLNIRTFKISRMIAGAQINSSIKVPVNILRILKNAQASVDRVVDPRQVIYDRKELISWAIQNASGKRNLNDVRDGLMFFFAMIRVHLATRSIVTRWKLTKQGWESVISEIKFRFLKARTPSGEMVGCLAGHSIGEPAQQMTLNTFHLAGVGASNMTGGISRLGELMRAAYECRSPMLHIYTVDGKIETAQEIIRKLKVINLKDIVVEEGTGVFYDPGALSENPHEKSNSVFEEDRAIINSVKPFMRTGEFANHSQFVIRLLIDKQKLLSLTNGECTIDHVYWKVREQFSYPQLIFKSPINAKHWVIRIHVKTSGVEFRNMLNNTSGRITKRDKKLALALTQDKIAETSSVKPKSKASKDDAIAKLNELEIVRQFAKIVTGARLLGVEGIKSISIVREQKVPKTYPKWAPDKLEPVIEIACQPKKVSCFATVLAIEGVDTTRSITNVVSDVETLFGIHAASIAQSSEYSKTYEENSSYVQDRHIQTVVDQTTKTGQLVSVNRNGFHQDDRLGFWKKISFERIGGEITDSAQQGKVDTLENIVSNIVVGAKPRVGTGSVVVYMDKDKLDRLSQEATRYNQSRQLKILPKLEPVDVQKIISRSISNHVSAFDKSLIYRGSLNKDVSQAMHMNHKLKLENARLVVPNYDDLMPLTDHEEKQIMSRELKGDVTLTPSKSTETFWSKLAKLNAIVKHRNKISKSNSLTMDSLPIVAQFDYLPPEKEYQVMFKPKPSTFKGSSTIKISWLEYLLQRTSLSEATKTSAKKRPRDDEQQDADLPMAKRLKIHDSRQDRDLPLDEVIEKAQKSIL